MADADEETIERLHQQSRLAEEALSAILGLDPAGADDPRWVTLPLRLPTAIAALMAYLSEQTGYTVHIMYANIILRGLWELGTDEDLPEVARAAAQLIYKTATAKNWDAWSARHAKAQEYVSTEDEEDGEGGNGP